MDLPWGDEKTVKFATNVGLITSNGPHGHNVMAAEWTHHVSYKPGLIIVNVGKNKATGDNIRKTGFFGISLAASDQNVAASVAGGSSGKDIDKIAALKELGVEFYKAKNIDVLMVKGAALNLECRLVKEEELGDHTMLVGEVLDAKVSEKHPIIYHGLKYWTLGEQVKKPDEKALEKIKSTVEKHRKK